MYIYQAGYPSKDLMDLGSIRYLLKGALGARAGQGLGPGKGTWGITSTKTFFEEILLRL